MTPVLADITEPIPLIPHDSGYPTSVLLMPVFVAGAARRRRLIVRGGYLAAAACLAYLGMLGVSITASPVSKPASATKPAPSVQVRGAGLTPSPQLPRAAPRAAIPVEVPAAEALADGDASQDAPLMLRLALPTTTRPSPSRPGAPPLAITTTHPHQDNDRPTTRVPRTSATHVTSSTAVRPPAPAPAAH